ncbi:unnamed protein product, partial [Pieris macdunnoughi]
WLTVTWAQSGMQLQPDVPDGDDPLRGRCGRAGSLAATPGEKLMELLRPNPGTPRRHSTAACAPPQPRPSGFVYCPSDALPYCPPSRLAPPRLVKLPPPPVQPVQPQPPPVPQRTAPVAPLPVPPAPPRRSPQPPRRVPPPTPPRPIATDPNGNRRIQTNPPRLDCNRNPSQPQFPTQPSVTPQIPQQPPPPPQPTIPRRPPQKMPDNPLPQTQIKRSPSSGSTISVRQDSNVSSDSFSQTSSPSYTTKTMEAPLLPQQHLNKSLNAKIARGLLLKEQQEKENANSSITKSMSTPASLQTIVRFQNGSNMSLHHRVS